MSFSIMAEGQQNCSAPHRHQGRDEISLSTLHFSEDLFGHFSLRQCVVGAVIVFSMLVALILDTLVRTQKWNLEAV